jgi:hypothetical protein
VGCNNLVGNRSRARRKSKNVPLCIHIYYSRNRGCCDLVTYSIATHVCKLKCSMKYSPAYRFGKAFDNCKNGTLGVLCVMSLLSYIGRTAVRSEGGW